MKKISLVAAAFAALALPGAAQAEVFAFISMPVTASQEVPPVNSSGHGRITLLYDDVSKVLTYSVTWRLNPGATVTDAHFHGPAAVGTAAGVAVAAPGLPATNSGKATGTVTLTAAQEVDLLAGRWYFNIHSTLAPGGELRGQLSENSARAVGAIYENNVLTLPQVLVPGIPGPQSYNAELTFDGSVFRLTGATPLR